MIHLLETLRYVKYFFDTIVTCYAEIFDTGQLYPEHSKIFLHDIYKNYIYEYSRLFQFQDRFSVVITYKRIYSVLIRSVPWTCNENRGTTICEYIYIALDKRLIRAHWVIQKDWEKETNASKRPENDDEMLYLGWIFPCWISAWCYVVHLDVDFIPMLSYTCFRLNNVHFTAHYAVRRSL